MKSSFKLFIIVFAGMQFFIEPLYGQKKDSGTYELVTIPAPSLKNNILGDPIEQKIGVYLPSSYFNSNKRFPVVYYLIGFSCKAGKTPPDKLMDELISNNKVREFILVEISGVNLLSGSFYHNSEVTGNWEDFVTTDVVSYIDNHYRSIPSKNSRGICGHSMGGVGTIYIALNHSDLFNVAYAMSPGLFDIQGFQNSLFNSSRENIKKFLTIEKQLQSLPRDSAHKKYLELLPKVPELTLILAYGSAFSPNKNKNAPYIDYPYYVKGSDTLVDKKIWGKWDYGLGSLAEKVNTHKLQLISYKHIGLNCGYRDPLKWLYQGVLYFSEVLAKNNIPFEMHLYDGAHDDKMGEQMKYQVLPLMSSYLSFE
jgi:enterochelin esterase-like enzyme